jgi:hypothetical protein
VLRALLRFFLSVLEGSQIRAAAVLIMEGALALDDGAFLLAGLVPALEMLDIDASHVLEPWGRDSVLGGSRDAAQGHTDVEQPAGTIQQAV